MRSFPLVASVMVLACLTPTDRAYAQQSAKLLDSAGRENDRFGIAVAITGTAGNEVAIVGAFQEIDQDPDPLVNLGIGAAHIYRKVGASWVQEATFFADDSQAESFGWSVAICGPPGEEIAIVGAFADGENGTNSGAAYIYQRVLGTWEKQTKLLASDGTIGDFFGASVAIGGAPGSEVAIVGAMGDADNGNLSGSAYIFQFDGTVWAQEEKLLAIDGSAANFFGLSVAINTAVVPGNEVVIVGAWQDANDLRTSTAYIFRKTASFWIEEEKLFASNDGTGIDFGTAVSISGSFGSEVAIVGAWSDDANGLNSGAAYIFRRGGSGWFEEQILHASDEAMGHFFGDSVAIRGNPGQEVAIVGAPQFHGNDTGAAYTYRISNGTWQEVDKFLAADGAVTDVFGDSVSICGTPGNEIAIIGATWDDDMGMTSGSAYIFDVIAPCPADIDNTNVVDVEDLLVLLGAWGSSPGSPADINNDDVVDVEDLLVLLGAWGGC